MLMSWEAFCLKTTQSQSTSHYCFIKAYCLQVTFINDYVTVFWGILPRLRLKWGREVELSRPRCWEKHRDLSQDRDVWDQDYIPGHRNMSCVNRKLFKYAKQHFKMTTTSSWNICIGKKSKNIYTRHRMADQQTYSSPILVVNLQTDHIQHILLLITTINSLQTTIYHSVNA